MPTRVLALLSCLLTATLMFAQGPIQGLEASGPNSALKDKLDLFGQFVGDWDFDMVINRPDGSHVRGNGEWHFGWTLDGRAVQDVWIARDDLSKANAPITEWGTTLRFYDARQDLWHVVWGGPIRGNLITFIGKKIGDEIVMEIDSAQGMPVTQGSPPERRGRWIFDQVTPNSFHWRAVSSRDAGKTWQMDQEMFVRRAKPTSTAPAGN